MPKAKTHKAARKRLKISKDRKFMIRSAGQDHFNAREPGKVTSRKRRDREVSRTQRRAWTHLLPYFRKGQ